MDEAPSSEAYLALWTTGMDLLDGRWSMWLVALSPSLMPSLSEMGFALQKRQQPPTHTALSWHHLGAAPGPNPRAQVGI